ncbi:MAG: uracil-DNA glycosylase [Xanthobacteraceae bacterium]
MPLDRKAALELLAFYRDAGVDALLGEEPVNHFAEEPAEVPAELPSGPRTPVAERPPSMIRTTLPPKNGTVAVPSLAPAPPAPDIAAMAAREAARQAGSLEELRTMLETFEGCGLRKTAKQLVFADGNPQARVMFVGEAPGAEEDRAGLPFVGRSGKLLDLMMSAIGLDRTSAYIANIIPWRPPGNRTPTPQESQICLPFILRQIELANPDVLVCLGGPSAQTILGFSDGIRRTRGRWLTFNTGTREIRAIATFHPAYLLRAPLEKRLAWRDFLAIKQALAS